MKRFVAEMQKAADAAEMSVLFFFQLVLIFEKAMRKTGRDIESERVVK